MHLLRRQAVPRFRVRFGVPFRALVRAVAFGALVGSVACARWQTGTPAGPDLRTEAQSFTGRALQRPTFDDTTAARLRAQLDAAADTLGRNNRSPDALIWVGRRLAYLGRYREAIDTFSVGVQRFPTDARFLRHRGHRYLTIRRPMLAIQDLARAATLVRGTPDTIEPDGAPNARNIPLGSLHFNILYHLGLAHYVQGDYAAALTAYEACDAVSTNPDLKVATAYWRYLTLRRLGRHDDAAALLSIARENPPLIENGAYLRVLRLFAGLEPIESFRAATEGSAISDVTAAYGVSMWHQFDGRTDEARDIWKKLAESPSWGAFGVLAAEMDLARGR